MIDEEMKKAPLWQEVTSEYQLEKLPDVKVETVIDIGANEGFFSLYARERWPSAIIRAYEPHPDTFQKLLRNTTGIRIYECAVLHPAPSEKVRLYEGKNFRTECSVRDDVRWPQLSQDLDKWEMVTAIDSSTLPPCDVLKIDTEGSEVEILEGYPHLKTVKVLLVEAHAVGGDLRGQMTRIAEITEKAGLRFLNGKGCVMRFVRAGSAASRPHEPDAIPADIVGDKVEPRVEKGGWAYVRDSGGQRWLGRIIAETRWPMVSLGPVAEMPPSKIFFPMPVAGTEDGAVIELKPQGAYSVTGTFQRTVHVQAASLQRLTDKDAAAMQPLLDEIDVK